MKINFSHTNLIILHIILGFLVFFVPYFSLFLNVSLILFFTFLIVKNKDRNNEALIACGYFVGLEVLLRMSNGFIFYELSKYLVILFSLLGIYYKGLSKKSLIYIFFLFLLLPGLILGITVLNFDTNIRKAIAFNLAGPVCLGIASLYTYNVVLSIKSLGKLLMAIGYPIISIVVFILLYNPSVRDVITNTQSSFETSGGFGPNQMSTILGFGAYIFLVLILLFSKSTKIVILNFLIFLMLVYRGFLTFSRGGMITAGIMMFLFLFVLYGSLKKSSKSKLSFLLIIGSVSFVCIWMFISFQTSGLIDKRYANQSANGVQKTSHLSGREILIESEMDMFIENPIFGVGVGKNKEYREELTGVVAASHNEISRMLAEHGSIGILALLLLVINPLLLYSSNRHNMFLLPFLVFWALTINHAAMRMAAPAFIYALSLLKVSFDEKPTLHRKQIT